MTTVYIVGNGVGVWTPRTTVSVAFECWGGGQAGAVSGTFQGGIGGGYAKTNAISVTAGTALTFTLGAPGTTTGQNGGDTWISNTGSAPTLTSQGALANGGNSATARVGNTTAAGGTSVAGVSGWAGGGGAAGPGGTGANAGTSTSGGGGGGGGGNGGGTAGASTSSAGSGVGGNGGNGFGGGTGGQGASTNNSTAGAGGLGAGGGGGFFLTGDVSAGGAGGDDWDNGGGGGGGAGGTLSSVAGVGGTPGGGGGAGNTIGRGGYGLIKVTYTSSDPDQIILLGGITTAQIPSSWSTTAIAECWGGGGGGGTAAAASSKGGGGGGAYAKANALAITPGGTLTVAVGAGGGAQVAGGDTTIAATTVVAKGGGTTTTTAAGSGGTAAASTGDVKSSGGNGGTGLGAAGDVGGGGGGAGGPDGDGVVGVNGTATQTTGAGGAGDNGSGGAGGATAGATNTAGRAGTANSKGGGGGSGSGGSSTAKVGGAGAFPGGGGGGGGGGATSNTGGAGGGGQIILTQIVSITLSWLASPSPAILPPARLPSTAALSSGATAWSLAPLFDYDWYEPFRDPYLVARMPVAAVPTRFRPQLPPPLGIIQWYAQLSTPPVYLAPRALPTAVSSPFFFPGFAPIVVPAPAFGYYTPFGNPPPPLPSRAVYMPPATGPPPNYAFDRWFQEALSEPPAYLRRPHLSTSLQLPSVQPITAALPPVPLISNIHPGLNGWVAGTYTLGQRFSSGGNAYQCVQAGTSTVPPVGNGSFIQMVPPSGFSSGFSSGWGNPTDTAAFKWLSAIDYTSLQAWSNDIMNTYGTSGLPAGGVQAINWNDSLLTAPLNSTYFFITGIPNNGAPTLITTAPGESFRDSAGGVPLSYNSANGVAFDAPIAGAEVNAVPLFFIDIANCTIDGFQFRDLNPTGNAANSGANANILVCLGGGAANFTVQNCILDGFHLFYSNEPNTWLKNCVLVNEQTTQAPSGNPLWPVKWDLSATGGGAVNCTGIGFNPTGTCSMFTTLGGTDQATIINTAVFGLPDPFFCQNTGGSITLSNCATDVANIFADNATDLGGNHSGFVVTNQFLNTVNDFRLKAISNLIDAGRADLIDLPSGQDIYRNSRPQGLGWDIGAVEFVYSLTWLNALATPPIVARRLPSDLRGATQVLAPLLQPETTTVDRWYHPLSRPLLPPLGLRQYLQHARAAPVTVSTPEIATVDRWLAGYPDRAPSRLFLLHPAYTQAHAEPISPVFVQDVSRLQWNASWPRSVPGRFIHPSVIPFGTLQPVTTVFREFVTLDRWHQPLALPHLWRRHFKEHAPFVTGGFVPIHAVPVPVTVTPGPGGVLIQGYSVLIRRNTPVVHA